MKTNSLGLLLHDAARALRKRFEDRASEFELSSAQWRMLIHVAKSDGAPQTRFAELLEVEPITASRMLDRLERLGWVSRSPDPNDRRVRIVTPTQKTLDAYAFVKATADSVYADALDGLGADERTTLIHALNTIIANLSASGTAGTKDLL